VFHGDVDKLHRNKQAAKYTEEGKTKLKKKK